MSGDAINVCFSDHPDETKVVFDNQVETITHFRWENLILKIETTYIKKIETAFVKKSVLASVFLMLKNTKIKRNRKSFSAYKTEGFSFHYQSWNRSETKYWWLW